MKFLLLLSFLIFVSCAKETAPVDGNAANHFSIESFEGYKILSVKEAWNGDLENHRWLLLDKNIEAPEIPDSVKNLHTVSVPIENAVILSTTSIAFMERLNVLEKITAVENRNYIYSEKMQHLIDSLNIKEVGSGNSLDLETLLILKPEIVLTFGTGSSTYDDYPRLENAGLPAVFVAEWMEAHPLARFEWLKVFGVLFGKEKEADSIYAETVEKYNSLVASANLDTERNQNAPIVLTGYPQGSEWLTGAGNSYVAKFLKDAGAKYIWEDKPGTGTLTLNIEDALLGGEQAQFWLHPSSWTTKEEILRNEPRMQALKSFQDSQIFQNSKRTGKNGSRDFYESAVANPDLVLADLIFIFHPEILPKHKFVYYELVK